MSFIQIKTHQYQGLEKKELFVQGVKTRGLAQLSLTGNISNTLRDSKDKIKAVVSRNSPWGPVDKILLNVLPSELPKFCPKLELPMALAIRVLLNQHVLDAQQLARLAELSFQGSLSLSGELREGEVFLPNGRSLGTFYHFEDLWNFLCGADRANLPVPRADPVERFDEPKIEAVGREWEKFWLRIAADVQLPVLLMGAPGIGKTHLAKWANQLLREPTEARRSEIDRIWVLAGQRKIPRVPLQNPHARTHLSEFLGVSQQEIPRPGLFALAHGGLLVLDEFPELSRDCREILRNILDEKQVRKNTKAGFIAWPADFWLLLTANPCACGMARGADLSLCRCPESSRLKYIARFSGPLLDRIGLKLFLTERERAMPFICDDSARATACGPAPLANLRLNARQAGLYEQLWRAFSARVRMDTESSKGFREFVEEQLQFQDQWMAHVYR